MCYVASTVLGRGGRSDPQGVHDSVGQRERERDVNFDRDMHRML